MMKQEGRTMRRAKQKRKCGIDYWPIIYVLPVIIACVMLSCSCSTLPDGWQDIDIGDVVDPPVTPPVDSPAEPPVTPPVSGYTITRWDANNVWWTGPNLTWPEMRAIKQADLDADPALARTLQDRGGPTCGEAHIYRANGQGGKFDHVRRDTKWRDFKNIPSYGVWPGVGEPNDGETVTLRLCSYDKQQWVTIGTFQWKR